MGRRPSSLSANRLDQLSMDVMAALHQSRRDAPSSGATDDQLAPAAGMPHPERARSLVPWRRSLGPGNRHDLRPAAMQADRLAAKPPQGLEDLRLGGGLATPGNPAEEASKPPPNRGCPPSA